MTLTKKTMGFICRFSDHEAAPRLLFLHGRGDDPTRDGPGTQVLSYPSELPVCAPRMDATWLTRPFAQQVQDVGAWIRTATACVGHSHGAYLLLCAAEEHSAQGDEVPPMLLLGCALGSSSGHGGRIGYRAPRATRIRRALGLVPTAARSLAPDRLSFVHGTDDEQCLFRDFERLAEQGFRVKAVEGAGHRLATAQAKVTVRLALDQLFEEARGDNAET